MMTTRIVLLLILIPTISFAQSKKKKKKHKPTIEHVVSHDTSLSTPDSVLYATIKSELQLKVYSWLNTRYQYGGTTRNGIDCSGFVHEIYKDVYCINTTKGSQALWTTVTPIEKTELKEGDLVFFKIQNNNVSHVGIYLSNNKFVHATIHSGVIISDLDEPYYKTYFFKSGRLVH